MNHVDEYKLKIKKNVFKMPLVTMMGLVFYHLVSVPFYTGMYSQPYQASKMGWLQRDSNPQPRGS